MFGVEPKMDSAAFLDGLSDIQQTQLPFAIAVALTRTAWLIVPDERLEMTRVFNNPVAWTLNSMYVDKATKTNLRAGVRFKDARTSAGFYLMPDVLGGARRHSMFEGRLIRSGIMRRDQYAVPLDGAQRTNGKLSVGQIEKILSDLRTIDTAQKSKNWRNRGARKNETYFATIPGAPRTAHMKPGIYMRDTSGGHNVVPVFAFTTTRPHYRAIFNFDGVAQRTADREFAGQLWPALNDAVRSSNNRGKWRSR